MTEHQQDGGTPRPTAAESEGIERLLPFDEHIEEVSVGERTVRQRGVYLLPNLLTTGALFAGFYSIVHSIGGLYEAASIAIFVAMLLDGLDGRVARLTNTQSAFGAEYDSLCDMVSFGVAPALLVFNWALTGAGKVGLAATFVYVACAALRLARFNARAATSDKRYFTGLASPSAAALLAAWVWSWLELSPASPPAVFWWVSSTALLAFGAGVAMVLNVRYSSFKQLDFKGRVPFALLFFAILVFFLIALDPPRVLLFGFGLYALSGPCLAAWRRITVRKKRQARQGAADQGASEPRGAKH